MAKKAMPAGGEPSNRVRFLLLLAALGAAHQPGRSWWLPTTSPRGIVGASLPRIATTSRLKDMSAIGPS